MADFKLLRAQLEEFKQKTANEFELRPIERWMCKELGVERLPLKGGSAIVYRHRSLEQLNGTGHFTIHKIHKKREMIYKRNFQRYLYPHLLKIIELMELEEQRGH